MKKISTLILICFALSSKADFWTQKADFPGTGLDLTFSFSIGNKGYVGCGQDTNDIVQNDFWEYDRATNVWTQKANFGGSPRWAATGFSIGNKGYAGLGAIAGNSMLFQDFWEYDPAANTWTQKANFGGGSRYVAVGFSIGNFGYIGTGIGTIFNNDLWQYNPVTNVWTQKTSMPVTGIGDANSFVIGSNAYIIGNCYSNAIWEYNSVTDTWTQKTSLPSTPRCDAAAFTICEKGYWGTGEFGGFTYGADLWQYNAVTDSWIQKGNFLGSTRDEPACFSIGSKGYIGLGGKDGFATSFFYKDFWEYTPDSACTTGIDEFEVSSLKFEVTPNPAKEFVVISRPANRKENLEITIKDVNGKKVYSKQLPTADCRPGTKINLENLGAGIYFVELNNGKEKMVKKFVKE